LDFRYSNSYRNYLNLSARNFLLFVFLPLSSRIFRRSDDFLGNFRKKPISWRSYCAVGIHNVLLASILCCWRPYCAPYCVGGPVFTFIPAVACFSAVVSGHDNAVILNVVCCWRLLLLASLLLLVSWQRQAFLLLLAFLKFLVVSCCWSLCYCWCSWCSQGVVGVSAIPFDHAVAGGLWNMLLLALLLLLAVLLLRAFLLLLVCQLILMSILKPLALLYIMDCRIRRSYYTLRQSDYRNIVGLSDIGWRPRPIGLSDIGLLLTSACYTEREIIYSRDNLERCWLQRAAVNTT